MLYKLLITSMAVIQYFNDSFGTKILGDTGTLTLDITLCTPCDTSQ